MAATTKIGTPVLTPGRRRPRSGPDRLAVTLLTLAAFLVVLAVLAGQLRMPSAPAGPRRVVLIRRIYRTTVVTDVPGSGGGGRGSVTQSVSSSGVATPAPAAPNTRTS